MQRARGCLPTCSLAAAVFKLAPQRLNLQDVVSVLSYPSQVALVSFGTPVSDTSTPACRVGGASASHSGLPRRALPLADANARFCACARAANGLEQRTLDASSMQA